MILSLLSHGILFLFFLLFLCKWLDDSVLIDICFYSLLIEFLISNFNLVYIYYCDFIFVINIGSIIDYRYLLKIVLVLIFDEISNFFFFILCFALILCFYFLIEYFEYDFNSTSIILLSSLFSQLALWFFCVYDIFLLILFWESISMVSFFLIQYWSFRISSYKASMKVFFISQIGDLPFFCFFFLLIYKFNTTDLFEINSQIFLILFDYIFFENFNIIISFSFLLSFLLSFAVLLKSAQFFFYPWLLDAMEAPVPISAQLHSSTLVIIGFYIYFRFQNFLLISPYVSIIYLFFGLITVVFASILGFFQEDGKKLLACSTASQLGYVIIGLGLFYFEESLLMLIFCCCNKAITFIWFGILMDRYSGLSDLRIIGGIHKLSLFEHTGLLLSLCNFTIIPGVFSWQIKSLYLKGQYVYDFFFIKYCLDILLLTWFFASLYFFFLYISLFLKSFKSLLRILKDVKFLKNNSNKNSLFFYSNYTFLLCSYILLNNFFFFKFLNLKKFKNIFINFLNNKNIFINFLNNSFWLSILIFNISWSFFFLLITGFFFLINFENIFFESIFDTSWINNFFYYYDFFFNDFYNF
jgi:NADH-quinone oxidoreductase subunit L